VDFNLSYTYRLVHAVALRDYYRHPPKPTILVESHYEGEHSSTAQRIRQQAYAALLNGEAGHIMGNRPIWLFDNGWEAALASPGSVSMEHLNRLILGHRWHELIPDFNLVTEGHGSPRTENFLSSARTPDGLTGLIYLPTSRTITVALETLAGDITYAIWFDPRTGLAAETGTFTGVRETRFTPPGRGDWLLILESSPAHKTDRGARFGTRAVFSDRDAL
jgi:hypothetical protein